MIVPEANLLPLIFDLPVIEIPDDDIELVVDLGCLNNPLQSPVRPSESAITKGYRLMDAATGEDSDDEDFDTAVKFGDLGVFDSRALDIWMKASKASSIKFRVQGKENWMKTTNTTLGLCFLTVNLKKKSLELVM